MYANRRNVCVLLEIGPRNTWWHQIWDRKWI